MQIGQNPEIVTYIEGEGATAKRHAALVIGSRYLELHAGQDDEPLLSLAFTQPPVADECARCHHPERAHGKPTTMTNPPCEQFVAPPPKAVVNFEENLRIVHDVPHVSHEFTADDLARMPELGITHQAVYPGGKIAGGRWEFSARDVAVAKELIYPAVDVASRPGLVPVGEGLQSIPAVSVSGTVTSVSTAPVVEKPKDPDPDPNAGGSGDGTGTVQ
jgi:hypothetical protein